MIIGILGYALLILFVDGLGLVMIYLMPVLQMLFQAIYLMLLFFYPSRLIADDSIFLVVRVHEVTHYT